MADLVGQTLGKYHLVARLGQGGMAEVYKAYQAGLNRYVAIKVLHPHISDEASFIGRFEREANAVARLRHPHIVQVYDFDSEGDRHYMVMEFLEGPSLKAEIKARWAGGPGFSLAEAVQIFGDLAGAVHYAHARGMVHRDLKPANVLFNAEGEAILTDFGIARILGAESYTLTGAVTGTPAYMSPEQGQGQPGDHRSDIYALGVILYELLTGRVPFDADTPVALIMKQITEPPPGPRRFRADLPEAVEQVVLRALGKDPDQRYLSASEMAKALREASGLTTEVLSAVVPVSAAGQSGSHPDTFTQRSQRNPYRGLFPFGEEDAASFFGREDFVQRLHEAVQAQPLVVVLGPSGSGKSSAVFAGLLPRLARLGPDAESHPGRTSTPASATGRSTPTFGGQRAPARWIVASLRPGSQPFYALAEALLPLLDSELSETGRLVEVRRLAEALGQGDLGLGEVVRRIARKQAGPQSDPPRLLLVADQFHELFVLCPDPGLRRRFLDLLLEAVGEQTGAPGLCLLVTLRSDFLGQAATHPAFSAELDRTQLLLEPMTRPELIRAIEAPARNQGMPFEPGLVDRILDDLRSEPGNLALLQFALSFLWEESGGRQLTHAAYDAIGRAGGALAHYADEVYSSLDPEDQALMQRLLVQMVRPGEGAEDTRRQAARTELGESGWNLAQRLADARLLVTSYDPATGHETAELVHDALIRRWGRLREWLDADRPFRAWQERLRASMRQWDASGLSESGLLYGAALAEAEGWWQEGKEAFLSPAERAFIQASLTRRERDEEAREARRRKDLEAAQMLADSAQRLAEAEKQRAEEHARATLRLRRRERYLAAALGIALLLFVSGTTASLVLFSRLAQAEAGARQATARELAAVAAASLPEDPQRALLLALEAVSATHSVDGSIVPEAEAALRQAILANDAAQTAASLSGLPIHELIALGHARLTRSLTLAECNAYLHLAECPPAP